MLYFFLSDMDGTCPYNQLNVVWAQKCQNAKIWLFGPRPPKMKKVKNNLFHQKHLTKTLPTSPQWLSDNHFSPRYDQKRVFDVDPYLAMQYITPRGYIWHNNGDNHQYSLNWCIISIIVCITSIINKFYHDLQNGQISFRDDSFRDGDQCLFDQVS